MYLTGAHFPWIECMVGVHLNLNGNLKKFYNVVKAV